MRQLPCLVPSPPRLCGPSPEGPSSPVLLRGVPVRPAGFFLAFLLRVLLHRGSGSAFSCGTQSQAEAIKGTSLCTAQAQGPEFRWPACAASAQLWCWQRGRRASQPFHGAAKRTFGFTARMSPALLCPRKRARACKRIHTALRDLVGPATTPSPHLTECGPPGADAACWERVLEGAVLLFYSAIPSPPSEAAERTSIW